MAKSRRFRLRPFLNKRVARIVDTFSSVPRTVELVWKAAGYWTIAWAILLTVQGLLPAATVYLTRSLVDALVNVAGTGISPQTVHPVIVPGTLMLGVLVLSELARGATDFVRTAQSEFVQDYLSQLVQQKSVAVDLGFYESSGYYDHLEQASSDAGGRSLALLESTGGLVQNGITLLAMATILIPYGLWLPALLIASTIPALLVMLRVNQQYHRWWQTRSTDRRRLQYYQTLLTLGSVAAEVRLFDLGPYFQSAYQTIRQRLRHEHLDLIQQQSISRLGASAIAFILSSLALVVLGRQVLTGVLSLGDLALFYQAFNKGQGLIRIILTNLGQIDRNSLFIKILFEFLNLPSQIVDPPVPVPVPIPIQQGIRFRHVTFTYPHSDRTVLENFDLTIPAGKIIAIVGDNGAGKSTLFKLLCRFYDPDTGTIEVDGIDIRQFPLHEYRRQITALFQSPIPYHLPAADNIALGDLAQPADPMAIEQAARKAGVHDVIARLPNGYDTLLGKWFPGGTELSGGEWQKLALARSFLRQAPLIILDEPTSAMDPWAEFEWLERFRDLANGQTAVVITHRFTLAMRADHIHVMRAGRIVESGNHTELLEQNGFYAQSWREQMQSNTPSPIEVCPSS